MHSVSKLLAVLLAAVPALMPAAHAARPLITDDARLVDAKACQVESWMRSNQGSREYRALPACNFTGNLELTLGGGRTSDAEGTHTSDVVLQGKTLFKPMDTNGWGIGLAVGAVRHPGDSRKISELYAYIPVSFSFHNDKVFLHTNVGVLRNNVTSSTRYLGRGHGNPAQRPYLADRGNIQTERRAAVFFRPEHVTGSCLIVRKWMPRSAIVSARTPTNAGFRLACVCCHRRFCPRISVYAMAGG